jgi:hypothetical protein
MFIPIEIQSVNAAPAGCVYTGKVELYSSPGRSLSAVVYRFTREGDSEPSVCDLIVRDVDGSMYVRDFLLQRDGRWRDSDGNFSTQLEALMPEEIHGLALATEAEISEFEVPA